MSRSARRATKVRDLLAREGRDDLALRVAVEPGGCSGLRYALFFDDRSLDGDVRGEVNGVAVVTDKMSAPYLTGASIDYLDTLEKSGFTIDNPNAASSCACGGRSTKARRSPIIWSSDSTRSRVSLAHAIRACASVSSFIGAGSTIAIAMASAFPSRGVGLPAARSAVRSLGYRHAGGSPRRQG